MKRMYKVPMDIPTHCNECPFGMCNYSYPLSGSSISRIDDEQNPNGTHGYVCNLEFNENQKYTKVLRAEYGEDIPKPGWCGLIKESDQK